MTQNELKYGEKQNDVISQMFAISTECGVVFCCGNAIKYFTRYQSDSEKGRNIKDVIKAKDYINRMHERGLIDKKELPAILDKIHGQHFVELISYLTDLAKKHSFAGLIERNYNSIVKRGLISEKTGFCAFSQKLFEECREFEAELYDGGCSYHDELGETWEIADKEKTAFEAADIILTAFNFLRHYDIDVLTYLMKKIEINENRS